jgi:ribose transport system substrate-binding protein
MKMTGIRMLTAAVALLASAQMASAKDLSSVGITLGSLGNPFFVALANGAKAQALKINPNAKVNAVSADYDLNKQFTQIDNFIASGVDVILLNAVDPQAIAPAIKKAQAAGIAVIAVDVAAAGADATYQTNNIKAGAISCQYLADKIGHKGNVIIENGPQVSSVIERVKGCQQVLSQYKDITLLSSDQNAKGSREGGLDVAQGYLTRFSDIAGIFTINDPQAIGTDLAMKQANRTGIVITSVDGAPDIETALKGNTAIIASASQDPYVMAEKGIEAGYEIINGKKPADSKILLDPKLITRDNVGSYQGWNAPR